MESSLVGYFPTERLAAEWADVLREARKAVEAGKIFVVPAIGRNAASLATVIRYALRAIDEHPNIAPDLVGFRRRVMVKVRMRERTVEVVSRESTLVVGWAKPEFIHTAEGEVTVEAEGRRLEGVRDILWVADTLRKVKTGKVKFTGLEAPEEAKEYLSERFSQIGWDLAEFDPPRVIAFRAQLA
jgi:hypothetical protein